MAFFYTNPNTQTKNNIFDCLRTAQPTSETTKLKIDGIEQTTYGIPISTSYANLPYGFAGSLGYKYLGTDIGLRFGPKGMGSNVSGTHTLNTKTTSFLIMAVGGGGGGGSGGARSGYGGSSGNSGTGGNCVYVAYPVVSGITAIEYTIGTGGVGGAARSSNGTGNVGTYGNPTGVSYNENPYVVAYGGPCGSGGSSSSATANVTNSSPSSIPCTITGHLNKSYIFANGTYTNGSGRIGALGACVAGNNSGFYTQFNADGDNYVNASSGTRGNGGNGGQGDQSGVTSYGHAGSPGEGGWVSIFEYFN